MLFHEAVSLAASEYAKDFKLAYRVQHSLEDKENDILIVFYNSPMAAAYVIENYRSGKHSESRARRIYPEEVPIEE